MTVAMNYFIELLEIDPVWIKILLFALIVNCLYPWKLSGKIETKEKDGKIISKIYHFK
jgi:hypothetical protein